MQNNVKRETCDSEREKCCWQKVFSQRNPDFSFDPPNWEFFEAGARPNQLMPSMVFDLP